jgi:hypothetical protein
VKQLYHPSHARPAAGCWSTRPAGITIAPNGQAPDAREAARGGFGAGGVIAWLAVGIAFLIGLYIALDKAIALF